MIEERSHLQLERLQPYQPLWESESEPLRVELVDSQSVWSVLEQMSQLLSRLVQLLGFEEESSCFEQVRSQEVHQPLPQQVQQYLSAREALLSE
jgi:hypothetical protein